ncbi:MAG TPA: HWE histidine kinase domain-containing protein [Allosphingosinicella sp.]|jgi:PAS domain S-box-containing protein
MASLPAESHGTAASAADPLLAFDWAATPLGPIAAWPQRLRMAAEICAHSSLPTALYWGAARTLVHNRAWEMLLGGRSLLGRPAAQALGALWATIGPAVDRLAATGEGTFVREQPLSVAGEESWWNINLLPLLDEDGRLAGVLNQANDVTKTVTVERRLSFLIRLADRLRLLNDPEDVKGAATAVLGDYLGAARVGYAEVDEAEGRIAVKRDWTRDGSIASLAGQTGALASFGEEALALLRAGEVLAIPDLRALPTGGNVAGMEALGVRALITVPLVREGALKALLYVHEPQPRAWSRAEAAIARDTAERTWSAVVRAQAEQSLRESEDHYRHAVELNPQVAWTSLPDGRLNRVASRWYEWTGTTGIAGSWKEGMHPDDHEVTLGEWARCLATGDAYDVEHRVLRREGGYRWARSRAFPRRDADGNIILWYGTTEDIHERRQAEEHQRLLINELNHRVKNTLATVQAIAFQTLKGDLSLGEARARFEARLMALSRAHNLLTEQNWGGAGLDSVVRDATEHLAGERARFDIKGAPVWLSPRAALALALALHELGTNAAKHGALSRDGGRIAIAWREDGDSLLLDWKESGGPPVTPPEQRGFGSRLIEQGLAADLGGSARLAFEPDGLRCRIEASLDAVRAPEAPLG